MTYYLELHSKSPFKLMFPPRVWELGHNLPGLQGGVFKNLNLACDLVQLHLMALLGPRTDGRLDLVTVPSVSGNSVPSREQFQALGRPWQGLLRTGWVVCQLDVHNPHSS